MMSMISLINMHFHHVIFDFIKSISMYMANNLASWKPLACHITCLAMKTHETKHGLTESTQNTNINANIGIFSITDKITDDAF